MRNDLYAVVSDGRVLYSGLSQSEAHRIADRLTSGVLAKRGGSDIRVPDFDVKPDITTRQAHESNYKLYKESR